MLGLLMLKGGYASGGGTGLVSSTSEVTFSLDSTAFLGDKLHVGMLVPTVSGGGFKSLQFTILENGTPFLSDSFSTVSAANAVLDDKVLDLGLVTSDTLDLQFEFQLTAENIGDSYADEMLFAVPEPSTFPLLGIGIAIALLARKKWGDALFRRLTGPLSQSGSIHGPGKAATEIFSPPHSI